MVVGESGWLGEGKWFGGTCLLLKLKREYPLRC